MEGAGGFAAAKRGTWRILKTRLTLSNYRCFSSTEPAQITLGPTPIALVGANNTGKSAILRSFVELRQTFFSSNPANLFTASIHGNLPVQPGHPVRDAAELAFNQNNEPIQITVEALEQPQDFPQNGIDKVCIEIGRPMTGRAVVKLFKNGEQIRPATMTPNIAVIALSYLSSVFESLHRSFYIEPLRTAHNVVVNTQREQMPNGQVLISGWNEQKRSGVIAKRQDIANIENRIRDAFGFKTFSLDAAANQQVFEATIDGRTYALTEVGTGLSQFISILVNIFNRTNIAFLLIDEPEANLHPELQVALIDILQEFTGTLIFASHNLGLAQVSAAETYAVIKIPEGNSIVKEIGPTDRVRSMLPSLVFSGFQDVGARAILFVEGVSDRPAVKQILKKLGHEHDVCVIPLNGDSSINGTVGPMLADVVRVSDGVQVYALIDSEKAAEDSPLSRSRVAFTQACEENHIKCHVLVRRALENYISDNAVRSLRPDLRALSAYEPLTHLTNNWPKAQNWVFFNNMNTAEIEATDLGIFLRGLCNDIEV